jgi:PHD/YefM family antitoxin component YafN of YafNO toxin-antitoxin module
VRQFITNEEGERTAVVLPLKEYEELVELAEDAEALREADEALEELARGEDEVVPIQDALREIQEGKVEAD